MWKGVVYLMGELPEKFCSNCGEKLPNDSVFCTKCGTKIDEFEKEEVKVSFFNKYKQKIIIGIFGTVGIFLICFIVHSIQVSNLKKELLRDWYKVEGEGSSAIICVLDFSDKKVEYRLETGYSWMDTSVATYEYKVISKNKVKIKQYGEWETITVKFNDDKSVMTVSPAITSIDDTEIWVNVD